MHSPDLAKHNNSDGSGRNDFMSKELVRGLGVLLIALGIIIALTSWVIFPVCEVSGLYVKTETGKTLPMT
jgi:hypothetical protein